MDGLTGVTELQPVEPGYKNVQRARLLMFWLPVAVGAVILDQAALDESAVHGLLTTLMPLLALLSISLAPQRIYRHLRYGLSDRLLQVVRGWMFHTDTVVP